MSAEESLDELAGFLNDQPTVNIVVASRGKNNDLTIFNVAVTNELSKEFLTDVSTAVVEQDSPEEGPEDGIELIKYEGDEILFPGQVCYAELSELELVNSVVGDFLSVDLIEAFKERDEIIDHLQFYVVVADNGREKALFFRSFSSMKELSRSRFKPVTLLDADVYDKMKQRVFLFDDEVDCFVWRGLIFIRNMFAFHKIFRYFEALQEKADETIALVVPRVPIHNQPEFEAACKKNPFMLAKLVRIAKQPYLADLNMEVIKGRIEKFKLDIKTETRDGTERLVFDASPAKRWIILKLLDDDYLESSMTGRNYAASLKKSV